MKPRYSALAALLGISAVLFIARTGTGSLAVPQERIEALEKRVSQIEDRVKSLEQDLRSYEREHRYFALPNLPPGLKDVPPDWKSFKFSGQTIYLVPLKFVSKPVLNGAERKKD